jgi:hypothetical protein
MGAPIAGPVDPVTGQTPAGTFDGSVVGAADAADESTEK